MDYPPFPNKRYRVILADPPWKYQNWSDKKHGAASSWYQTMTTEQIAALPVVELADKDCALFLWCTWPKMVAECAFDKVMRGWGFRPVTGGFVWNKVYASGKPYCGLGFYTRSGSEPCLLGLRGKPRRKSASIFQVFTAVRQKHSQKPACQYAAIEDLFDGPYIELFARGPGAPGWDVWGAEATPVSPGETNAS